MAWLDIILVAPEGLGASYTSKLQDLFFHLEVVGAGDEQSVCIVISLDS